MEKILKIIVALTFFPITILYYYVKFIVAVIRLPFAIIKIANSK